VRPKLPKLSPPPASGSKAHSSDDPCSPVLEARAVPARLQLAAAGRLVAATQGSRQAAARRFLASAGEHGIDPALMWATIGSGPQGGVRQVCLAVPGSGRTATLFLAPPDRMRDLGDADQQHAERIAAVEAACVGLGELESPEVALAQSLPEPAEPWAIAAFTGAGFQRVGDLAYLRRPLDPPGAIAPPQSWDEGIEVISVDQLGNESDWHPQIAQALVASYEDTLDCPELCGLRDTVDVLASHRSTGKWNPALWWLVLDQGQPLGVALFAHCPEVRSVELVYIGLGPALRGRGLGRKLLDLGLAHASGLDADEMTCAVDRRNAPAMRLYESMGFAPFAQRVALVRPILPRAT